MAKSGPLSISIILLLALSYSAMQDCPQDYVLKDNSCIKCSTLAHTTMTNSDVQQ
jgi:hypothetical protein